MDIAIDHERCMGAGQCVLMAPEVFDQDEHHGLALLRVERPGRDHYPAVREARDACPRSAITLAED
ncbi:ferredoxin [Streptomyces sp. TP-A0356]|uniref:ferredoxin n=1 Tax=Streptomyces sp. TP-A0356 TaxID=1359208 RepID=UPI0006E430D8|nr:ferredoxin [Streptomyces sp. TP-A0356]